MSATNRYFETTNTMQTHSIFVLFYEHIRYQKTQCRLSRFRNDYALSHNSQWVMWLKIITSVNDKEKPYIYLLLAEYNLKHFFFLFGTGYSTEKRHNQKRKGKSWSFY